MYEFDTGYRGSFSKETQSYAKRRESHLRWANAHQVPSSSCCCQKAQSSAESSCCEGRVAEVAAFEHVATTGSPPPRPGPGAPTLPTCPWPKAFSAWPPCLDRHSRCELGWQLSNSLDIGFCLQALDTALCHAPAPYIFNSHLAASLPASLTNKPCPPPAAVSAVSAVSAATAGTAPPTDNGLIDCLWHTVE